MAFGILVFMIMTVGVSSQLLMLRLVFKRPIYNISFLNNFLYQSDNAYEIFFSDLLHRFYFFLIDDLSR